MRQGLKMKIGEAGRWIRLRSGGVVKVNTGCASVWDVVRDYNGNWICGFNSGLGNCSVLGNYQWCDVVAKETSW